MRYGGPVLAAAAAVLLAAGTIRAGNDAAEASPLVAARPAATAFNSTVVMVVNPSRRVRRGVFRHAREIVAQTARPRMRVVGIYEQVSTDDGAPFDRHFLSESGVAADRPRPKLPPEPQPRCSDLDTDFRRKECERKYDAKVAEAKQEQRRWHAALRSKVDAWRHRALSTLERVQATHPSKESSSGLWDLRGALIRTGSILVSRPTDARCVVLLGGLAVKPPPPRWPTKDLAGATLIAAGWRGTPAVRDAWTNVLAPAGARIEFLPADVTELDLVASVRTCVTTKAPATER
jgi:hypothetical protein